MLNADDGAWKPVKIPNLLIDLYFVRHSSTTLYRYEALTEAKERAGPTQHIHTVWYSS
jgi:hypothetical protein